ncbi:MAG: hypothetical protein M3176_12320, partial [Chloroflexota bacterium]|nr:hypothetical protein [Chloroflexota bacterium]
TLGAGLSFQNLAALYVYARGATSSLTFDSAVSGTRDLFLQAENALQVTNSLNVTQTNTGQTTGLNISLRAGGILNVGGNLSLQTDASNVQNGGNISVTSGSDMTIGGNFSLLVQASPQSTTGTGGNISVNSGAGLSAGSVNFNLDFNNSQGVNNGTHLTLNVNGSLTTTSGSVVLTLFTPIGHTLGNGGNLTMTIGGNLTTPSGTGLELSVVNTVSTTVPTGANLFASVGGNLNTGDISASIENESNGGIGTGGNLTFNVNGTLTASGISIQTNNSSGGHIMNGGNILVTATGGMDISGEASFLLLNNGGSITSGGGVRVNAGHFNIGGSLRAYIDNVTGTIGGTSSFVSVQSAGQMTIGGDLFVNGFVASHGDINAGSVEVRNLNTNGGNLIVGDGGINRFRLSNGLLLETPYVLTAATITSSGALNFSGDNFGGGATSGISGGDLTINATSLVIGSGGIAGPVTFNGGQTGGGSDPNANGGNFTVNTSGAITVNSDIEATSGLIDDSSGPRGNGGSVTLNSTSGPISVNSRIQVSSNDPSTGQTPPPPRRRSQQGGNITLRSNLTTGPGITLSQTGQLLSLLDGSAPGPAGAITLSTMGADIVVNGTIRADFGTITIDQNDPAGAPPTITLDGATIQGATFNINGSGDLAIGPNNNTAINIFGGTWNVAHDLTLNAAHTSFAFSFTLNATAGNAINFTGGTSSAPVALALPLSGNTAFNAGAGGINAQFVDISYAGAELNLMSAGDITANSIKFSDFTARGNVNATGTISILNDLWEGSITAGGAINVGGSVIASGLSAGTDVVVGQFISATSVTAGGDITAGSTHVQNITSPTGVLRVANGISPHVFSTDPAIVGQGAAAPHVYSVDSIIAPTGIDFSGNQFDGIRGYSSGGLLTINARTVTFDRVTGVGPVNFNGADVNGFSNGTAPTSPGDGGSFTVNTTGDITVNEPITASTGLTNLNGDIGGTGGTVNLSTTGGTVTVGSTIQVSHADPTPGPSRRSAAGGTIRVTSNKAGAPAARAVAVNLTNSSQLLSLLAAAPSPGPGGKVIIRATGANSDVNVRGRIQADRGLVDIRHTGTGGNITADGTNGSAATLNLRGDIVKIAALGDNGILRVGGGIISADTTLQLYATGFNGEVRFVANVSLTGNSVKSIAGNSVTINNGVLVNIGGPAASVYVNSSPASGPNANYTGFGGNGSTTGTFGGS